MSCGRTSLLALFKFGCTILNMEDEIKGRGGPGRGQGRKTLGDADPTVSFPVKMTTSQRDKLKRLGGAPWVRDRIDKAKEPKHDDE